MEDKFGECYLCGDELTSQDDSGRCESCMDELSDELGEGWDN